MESLKGNMIMATEEYEIKGYGEGGYERYNGG